MTKRPAIVWFRQDLRLADNPALVRAASSGRPLLCVFIWDPSGAGAWCPGQASRWWLYNSLLSLRESLALCGLKLILRTGEPCEELASIIKETGARELHFNRCHEPFARRAENAVLALGLHSGVEICSHNGSLLHEPSTIRSRQGGPYKVYTPFLKACLAGPQPPAPLPAPPGLTGAGQDLSSLPLDALELLPSVHWYEKLGRYWQPGESGAQAQLASFLAFKIDAYREGRNVPGIEGTSRLSPHLHFGEISPRQIWHAAGDQSEAFTRELYWREFCHHLLHHFPSLPEEPLQAKFRRFPWASDQEALHAWRRGKTGFPIVDAGMRQLWETGWMHNRVRMIVGSFLVKDLRLPWQEGEKWFWDTLVDADLANNACGWQWISGCGADAAPYFRIFNPVTQGEKFDPGGDYVRRYVPELAPVPTHYIHRPWEAPADVLGGAGVRLGVNYPLPIVDRKKARAKALEAFGEIRNLA